MSDQVKETETMTMQDKRWYCVDHKFQGRRVHMGRIETTGDELREALGPYADINPVNGECYAWAPKPRARSSR